MATFMDNLKFKQYLPLGLLSFTSAVFVYLLLFFVGHYAYLYFAYDFDIGAFFDFNGIYFDIERSNPLWTYDATVSIILARPLVSLVIGVISLLAITLIKEIPMVFYFLLLWLNVFAFNAAFGLFITDFITQSGVYFVAESMELGIIVMIFSLVVSSYLMYRLGKVNTMVYLNIIPQENSSQYSGRLKIVVITIFIPWLLTAILMTLLSYIVNNYSIEHLNILSAIFLLIPFLFCRCSRTTNNNNKQIEIKSFEWVIAVLLIMFSVLLYVKMLSPLTIMA